MSFNPILIVPGEIKSVFFEIFFKAIRLKNYKSSLILVCNKKILFKEIKKFNYKKKIIEIDYKDINEKRLIKNKIYFIDVTYKNPKNYVQKCFTCAFDLLKKGYTNKFINGPINKTKTLNKKYLGVTEYIAKSFKKKKICNVDIQ